MSTKKTEKTEITSTATTDNKVSDNKAVFGPLGKYAVVAVIMVSIIVTTAIVLDKELGTAEEKLAAVENKVAAANAVDEETAAKVESSEAAASIEVIAETGEAQGTAELAEIETGPVNAQAIDAETAEVQADNSKVIVAIKANETTATVKETAADENSSVKQVSNLVHASSTQATAKIESARTDTKAKNSFQERQSQSVADNQYKQWPSRIEVYKLEQKQHMTERFTRIKSLESEQLDQYKARQEKQIERLREQIAQQQQVIETLILRNQERFDMRAASMQRHQARREQILNRI
jgi:hypothetical protein